MKTRTRTRLGVGLAAAGLLAGLGLAQGALADPATDVFHACLKNGAIKEITVNDPPDCHKSEIPVSWNAQGPQGLPGPEGPAGEQGPAGAAGTSVAITGLRFGDLSTLLPNSPPGELVGTLPVPAGSYLITATVDQFQPVSGSTGVACELQVENDADSEATSDDYVLLEVVHTFATDGEATVHCWRTDVFGDWESIRITAVQVTTAANVPLS